MSKRIVSSYGTRLGTEKGVGADEVRESWKSKSNAIIDLNSVALRSVSLENVCASERPTSGLAYGVKMSCGTASPGNDDSWTKTHLTEREQADAAEACVAVEACPVLLKVGICRRAKCRIAST